VKAAIDDLAAALARNYDVTIANGADEDGVLRWHLTARRRVRYRTEESYSRGRPYYGARPLMIRGTASTLEELLSEAV